MNFNNIQKKALADLLLTGELKLQSDETYKGRQSHKSITMQWLLKEGYATIKGRNKRGMIESIMPTEKAVNCINVNA